jgi:LysM repeat protein
MSRRDTIIIAVLINAGLLVVLFSTALKSNKSDEIAVVPLEKTIAQPTEIAVNQAPVIAAAAPKDEVDHVLNQLSQPVSDVSNTLSTENTIETKNDFIQDLNGISTQSQPVMQEAPSSPSVIEVTVKKGDVLEKIARAHKTTVEDIMRLNHLNSTRLKIGQVLKVSPGASSPRREATREAGVDTTSVRYYTVKNGDNPWTIAVKNHMKVEELLKLNNLDKEKARHLKPGDKLKIKG